MIQNKKQREIGSDYSDKIDNFVKRRNIIEAWIGYLLQKVYPQFLVSLLRMNQAQKEAMPISVHQNLIQIETVGKIRLSPELMHLRARRIAPEPVLKENKRDLQYMKLIVKIVTK